MDNAARRARNLVTVVAFAGACASGITASICIAGISACSHEAPLTAEQVAKSDQSARIGALIFAQETAHARASQALAAAVPNAGVRGAITRASGDGAANDGTATTNEGAATTMFLTGSDAGRSPSRTPDAPQVAYEVVTSPGAKPVVTRVDPA